MKNTIKFGIAILFLVVLNSCKDDSSNSKSNSQNNNNELYDCFCGDSKFSSALSRDSLDYRTAFTKFYFEDSGDYDSILKSLDSMLTTKMNLKDTSEPILIFKKLLIGGEGRMEACKISNDFYIKELLFYVREVPMSHREVINSKYVRTEKITKVQVGEKFKNVYTNGALCQKYKTKVSFVLKWVKNIYATDTSESKIDQGEIIFANNNGTGYDVIVEQPILAKR
ncbi:hypothetical protein [Kordia sp.]|uniref:hypothetical protein n=1 Tax=Kordia sp. TaxID=1965332 RepID=UPI003D6BCC2A